MNLGGNRGLAEVLGELTTAGRPWLAIDLPGPAGQSHSLPEGCDATVVSVADQGQPPVMINPLEPEPGFGVQAHARRLAELTEAVFELTGPVAEAVRAGLLRVYADSGWDLVTGAAPPGAEALPPVPAFAQLRRAVLAMAQDLGYAVSAQAAVRAFLRARLEPMWAGPSGRFLEGGHPADIAALLRGNVLLTGDGLAGDEAAAFLTGAVLARAAEWLRVQRPCPPPVTIVLTPASSHPAAAWFGAVTQEIQAYGGSVIAAQSALPGRAPELARWARPAPSPEPAPSAGHAPAATPGPAPAEISLERVLLGRRSAACGARCRDERPCRGFELHEASLLARADGHAWLRLWSVTVVLAFLTGHPLPRVPQAALPGWRALSPRRRECVLATMVDTAVMARGGALWRYYHPGRLVSVAAQAAAGMLDGSGSSPFRPGPVWVIPPLRWLHEAGRLTALGRSGLGLDDIAPPLDFGLAGLPDWPGIRVRDRLSGLRDHPWSVRFAPSRRLAALALHGSAGRASFEADLAIAITGLTPAARLRHAAAQLEAGTIRAEPGWLEVVLSWPDRMALPVWDEGLPVAVTG